MINRLLLNGAKKAMLQKMYGQIIRGNAGQNVIRTVNNHKKE